MDHVVLQYVTRGSVPWGRELYNLDKQECGIVYDGVRMRQGLEIEGDGGYMVERHI
jgi:hypothetical protein